MTPRACDRLGQDRYTVHNSTLFYVWSLPPRSARPRPLARTALRVDEVGVPRARVLVLEPRRRQLGATQAGRKLHCVQIRRSRRARTARAARAARRRRRRAARRGPSALAAAILPLAAAILE